MNEDEVAKAYDTVQKSLKDKDFRKWLNTPEIKDSLGYDYDLHATHMMDNFEEPMGYDFFALGRYLDRDIPDVPDIPEGIDVITLKDEKDVEKLHDKLFDVLGE